MVGAVDNLVHCYRFRLLVHEQLQKLFGVMINVSTFRTPERFGAFGGRFAQNYGITPVGSGI